FHVDRLIVIFRIDRDRQIKLLWIRLGKTGVAVGAPLHWSADTVPVAQIEIVPHSDFIAVIKNWRPGHGEKENIEQLDFATVVREQWREAAADPEINAGVRIIRVNAIHVIPL